MGFAGRFGMVAKARKINLANASLDVVCPKRGKLIPPAAMRRFDFEHAECLACGERF
jgi:hypothetical protein